VVSVRTDPFRWDTEFMTSSTSPGSEIVLYQTEDGQSCISVRLELDPAATVKQYLTVQTEGGRKVERGLDHYERDSNDH
jgi:hypothetical protein